MRSHHAMPRATMQSPRADTSAHARQRALEDPRPRDERSMRVFEVMVAAAVLGGIALISLSHPADGRALPVIDMLAGGAVLLVVALVSLFR